MSRPARPARKVAKKTPGATSKRVAKKAPKTAPRASRPMTAAEIREAFRRWQALDPEPKTELEYSTPFELLVAVALSAQATDVGVNKATRKLFPVANTRIISDHYAGGPVGIETISAALSEPRDALEDIIEPFLIQRGFIQRTPRGRMMTSHAYKHLGLQEPKRDASQMPLFDQGEE